MASPDSKTLRAFLADKVKDYQRESLADLIYNISPAEKMGSIQGRGGPFDSISNGLVGGGLAGLSNFGQSQGQRNLQNQQAQSLAQRDALDAMRYQMDAQARMQDMEIRRREHEAYMRLELEKQRVTLPEHIIRHAYDAAEKVMPKKSRHAINYDKPLLAELRAWRDKWLEKPAPKLKVEAPMRVKDRWAMPPSFA